MKKRARKPVVTTPVEKPRADQFEIMSIPFSLPIAEFARAVQEARNRALAENRTMELDSVHPKGLLVHLHPAPSVHPHAIMGIAQVDSKELAAIMFSNHFIQAVIERTTPWNEETKKKLPEVVKEMIKSAGFNSEKLHKLAEVCEMQGKQHTCESPECRLTESWTLTAEAIKSHIKENLQ